MSKERFRVLQIAIMLIPLAIILLLLDALSYQVTLPVTMSLQNSTAIMQVGSDRVSFQYTSVPTAIQVPPADPIHHEYQIDGTDSTNNFTLDPVYLSKIASSPYYQFQAWMRDLDGTSRWRNITVQSNDHQLADIPKADQGTTISLPNQVGMNIILNMQLQRPETPMHFSITNSDGGRYEITVDRNDRNANVMYYPSTGGNPQQVAKMFLPTNPLPFAAMVVSFLTRVVLWAILVLAITLIGEVSISILITRSLTIKTYATAINTYWPAINQKVGKHIGSLTLRWKTNKVINTISSKYLKSLNQAIHPIGYLALIASFIFVNWIALVQYHAMPHIYDSNAYLFGAKIFSTGHLSLPIPSDVNYFPGPFMVQHGGRWFTQYAPGTSMTLAVGLLLGVPWLVEPLLGTLALLGIGFIASRLYDRRAATLAIILGALSPFYSYIAASYLSHTIALFYLVWGFWAFLRFAQKGTWWNLPLAALMFGMGGLTRDLIALLFIMIVVPGILIVTWKDVRQTPQRWIMPGIAFLTVSIFFLFVYFGYNATLTGNPFVTPRSLFFKGDRWGFGSGIGFYGQHTLASGFVTVDELLTSLAITLFGWPFYLTLAFLALPFLTLRAKAADWFMLVGASIMIGAFLGYYYHGIYLGPRYVYETLPFLLILTARGIVTLADAGLEFSNIVITWWKEHQGIVEVGLPPQKTVSVMSITIVGLLLACNLLYYMPRQITLHTDFTGVYYGYHFDTKALIAPPIHHAIVVTGDYFIYGYTLFSFNDPGLSGDVLYAFASDQGAYQRLLQDFPGRKLYRLDVSQDGHVTFTPLIP